MRTEPGIKGLLGGHLRRGQRLVQRGQSQRGFRRGLPQLAERRCLGGQLLADRPLRVDGIVILRPQLVQPFTECRPLGFDDGGRFRVGIGQEGVILGV